MAWTHFWDMHSGGGTKETYDQIFIEAPEDEAVSVFYSKFGHSPNRVSCTCCGEDYSISEYESLEAATAYHRNDYDGAQRYGYRKVETLEDYLSSGQALVISNDNIEDYERNTYVPKEGYVWR